MPPLSQTLRSNAESKKGRTAAFALNGDGQWTGLPADTLVHGGRSMTLFWIDRRQPGMSGVFLSQRLVSVVTDPADSIPDEAYNGWERGKVATRRFTALASQMLG